MKTRLSKEEIYNVVAKAIKGNTLITRKDSSVLFYNLETLSDRIKTIKKVFPESTLHTAAAKANPLIKILEHIKDLNVGLEVASEPELYIAEKVGFPSNKIVFDSPVKTKKEIEQALKLGVYLNADSFDELNRINEILISNPSKSSLGIRVNPQVGSGAIKSTSVADSISKFGIPLSDNSEKLKEYFLKFPWLKGIHVHIGSQGCPVPLLVDGIRKVMDFAVDMNNIFKRESLNRRIEVFDIGGGLPVSYYFDKEPFTMEKYFQVLNEKIPELFSDDFKLITEFGRFIHANAGWAISRVEYVKREKGYNIIMQHLGADLLLRKCYNPSDWHHEITLVDKTGKLKIGKDKNKYIIAGPLCFAGDVIAIDLDLPIVEEGDYIVIHDVGAYTLSMWSRYNSRQIPKVVAYNGKKHDFHVIKEREELENVFEFWK